MSNIFQRAQRILNERGQKFAPSGSIIETYAFTGCIQCGICGAPYRRKRTAINTKYDKTVWICATFNTLGKSEYDSQQIPENILRQKVNEAGGLDQISATRIPDHNRITFILKDGRTVETKWQHTSRRESWTPKMKQAARERQQKILNERRCSM